MTSGQPPTSSHRIPKSMMTSRRASLRSAASPGFKRSLPTPVLCMSVLAAWRTRSAEGLGGASAS
eukprot:8420422-Pyramimonas_sp.AAC.1